MDYAEFLAGLKQISRRGYIKSHREGDTGIGKTLEDELRIEENNIPGPDFSTYELKSTRRESGTMITLFTESPSPKGANRRLLDAFGYPHRKASGVSSLSPGDKELHVTVDSREPNSVGLKLVFTGDRLCFDNDKGVDAYYDGEVLKKAFERKSAKMIYVIADSKKEGGNEFFWYNEAYRLQGFSFKKFAELVKDGLLKVDLRLGHYRDGKLHDHGTAFRIQPRHFPRCFENVERILSVDEKEQMKLGIEG